MKAKNTRKRLQTRKERSRRFLGKWLCLVQYIIPSTMSFPVNPTDRSARVKLITRRNVRVFVAMNPENIYSKSIPEQNDDVQWSSDKNGSVGILLYKQTEQNIVLTLLRISWKLNKVRSHIKNVAFTETAFKRLIYKRLFTSFYAPIFNLIKMTWKGKMCD